MIKTCKRRFCSERQYLLYYTNNGLYALNHKTRKIKEYRKIFEHKKLYQLHLHYLSSAVTFRYTYSHDFDTFNQ